MVYFTAMASDLQLPLRLYNYYRSSASYRVRIALAFKGIPYEYVPVHLIRGGGEQRSSEHHARNPMEQVPALEFTWRGERRVIAQSVAIIEFLEELFPEPPLFPRDPFWRARARELVEIINSGIQPHQNLTPTRMIDALVPGAGLKHAQHFNRIGLQALEERVRESAGRYAIGDEITVADVFIVPQLTSARRFEVDLSPYPTLLAIEANLASHPAFESARPERQPDYEPT
ncbi:MAG: maleylacetoacetate isomerase [Sandaracinaceae bacterium]|nr:maleylacetoacetate isomerase [Sandaracinaceae bacterium]